MAPLVLEGENLGKKHQHYNILLKEALDRVAEPQKIHPDNNDIENLLQIDVACNNRNVDYILDVLKSEDLLYISRAIKRSTWLVTDKQYSHIINPEYLNDELFPHMTSKAINKLLLHIRLNLKDEDRVEVFYKYFKEQDLKKAFKWLPQCSIPFIEQEVMNHNTEMEREFIKRLCERSVSILDIYIQKCDFYKRDVLKKTMFLLNSHTEKYLDLAESVQSYEFPSFGAKATTIIMKKCRQRVMDKFEKYASKLDVETLAKFIKREEIKTFLSKHAENENLQSWFSYDNIKHFIKRMPKDGRFEFLKKVFIEKAPKTEIVAVPYGESDFDPIPLMRCAESSCPVPTTSSANIYRWYRFASFDIAFPDLIKLMRTESSSAERNEMLAVLLYCARHNGQHIQTLLQYYHDKHINEPFKFKIQFVNMVLSQTNTHKFEEKTWSILNTIFHSLEVYIESDNNVKYCIQAIIIYKLLHNETVPEIVEKKFVFDTMKPIQKKLDKDEKEKVFNYLYKLQMKKVDTKKITNETELSDAINELSEIMALLTDWKKELLDYPWILIKIRDFIKIQKENSWKTNIASLYIKRKSWRKHLFVESLDMNPSAEVCINALKHDPKLMSRNKTAIDALRSNEGVSLRQLLKKLRVYWPLTLAAEWAESYQGRLNQASAHKSLAKGLCVLLPQNQLLDLVTKYVPTETKINWSEEDEIMLSLRKHFAKNLYLARPLLPIDTLLMFAKGDYLQFALPSLEALFHDISATGSRKHIKKLLEAPVSLQKHGIRLAFTKLKSEELKKTFMDAWNSTKNASIRAVLFKKTFELLGKEKKPSMIEEIWELLSYFMDNLSKEENKTIYEVLAEIDKVPRLVRGKYCMKSYKILKSLPAKANCESLLQNVVYSTRHIMEMLDPEFVEDILLDSLDKKFTTERYGYDLVMRSYLLCAKDEASQMQRYEKILVPLLERCFALWNVKLGDDYYARKNMTDLLKHISREYMKFVLVKDMVFPVKMFENIHKKLEERLPIEKNYILLRQWKLTTTHAKLLEQHKELIPSIREGISGIEDIYYEPSGDDAWNELYFKACPEFAKTCIQFLKEDMDSLFPSIYQAFAKALDETFDYGWNQNIHIEVIRLIVESDDSVASYLLGIYTIPRYYNSDEARKIGNEIRAKIYSHPSAEVRIHYCTKFESLDQDFENK